MQKLRGYGLVGLVFVILFLNISPAVYAATPQFNDPGFANTWQRVDKPVQDLAEVAGRGYTWGPPVVEAVNVSNESYNGATRRVQYFDKARMEVNNPSSNPTDLFYVTTGLLVKEMVSGQEQEGDNTFRSFAPSGVPVAGDSNDRGDNWSSPTYATFNSIASLRPDQNVQLPTPNRLITTSLDKAGTTHAITPPEQQFVTGYDDVTRHNIADVFVQFNGQRGLVWNGSAFVQDAVFFNSSVYVLGRPITEPYWIKSKVARVERDVLVQLFERRVLTYTPANPVGFKVEMGNVGQHYYAWRYLLNRTFKLAQTTIDPPSTTGSYLFWKETNDVLRQFHVYDVAAQQSFMLTSQTISSVESPTGNGKTIAWIEYSTLNNQFVSSLQGYDRTTNKQFEIVPPDVANQFSHVVLYNNVIYYVNENKAHEGFFALNLTTRQEQKIDSYAYKVVVSNGLVLWLRNKVQSSNTPPIWSLHLRNLNDSNQSDLILSEDTGMPDSFTTSGRNVVWSTPLPAKDTRVHIYNLDTKTTTAIPLTEQAYALIANGPKLAWVITSYQGQPEKKIFTYDLNTKVTTVLVKSEAELKPLAFTQEGQLIYWSSFGHSDDNNIYIS